MSYCSKFLSIVPLQLSSSPFTGRCCNVTLERSLLQVEQPKLSQTVYIGEVLHPFGAALCFLAQPLFVCQPGLSAECSGAAQLFVPPEVCYQGLMKLAFYLLLLIPARTVAGSRQWVRLLQVLLTPFHFVYFSKKRDCATNRHKMLLCLHCPCYLIHISSEETLLHGLCVQTFVCVYIVQIFPFSK